MPAAKFVAKGDWICRSRRARQIHLQEAKIISDFYSIRAIFAFVGFVNGLGAGSFPGPVLLAAFSPAPDAIQTRMRQRFPAFAGNRNGAVRFAAMRERRRDWMAARLPRTSFCRSARQMRAKERAARRKTQSKRPWAEILRCHSLCAVVSFSYAAGVCAGAVGVALASGEAPGDAMRMGVMTSPPRTPKLSVSGKR